MHIQVSFLWAFDPVPQVEARLHELFPDYDFTNQTVSGTINIFQFSALYTILHMTVPISPVYVIIFILRRKIIRKLCDNSESMTKETRQLHSQLLMALTCQSMIPAFYLCAVVSFAIGQLNFFHHPILEYTVFISFIFIPVFSPLASLYFVGPYR
ncbi:hypothetical protein WR25_02151 [Diploscapter pachys]|uniref:G-protein coupled receptors family 1 profile domain-containing protein n=1 Tax=Diploscapter pachys TaxID=2018661 RepID=A0A2A2KMB6_9BILA|nr:hypothetical protein WR25_02151 [Diploscapter pachys]